MENIIDRWKEIAARNKKEAEKFYRETILPQAIKDFSAKDDFRGKYDFLISLVGFSPEPIVLMLHAIKPQKTLFLYTREAERSLDLISQFYPFSSPSEYDKVRIDSSRVEDIYEKIKDFLKDKPPERVAVDITGGKKAMVSGASAAAALADCRILYMDYTEYNSELRKPVPGTEFINELKNPIEIFGEFDAEKGKELFRKGDFSAATEIFSRLKQRVMRPEKYELYSNLASFFSSWEEYDFPKALTSLTKIKYGIERYRIFKEWDGAITKYREIMEQLVQKNEKYFVLNHYFISKRYRQRQKFDFSALLLYRTLEMAVSYRLKEKYKIDSSHPNYSQFPDLAQKYKPLVFRVYGKEARRSNLPIPIGLMDGIILLNAFNDKMFPKNSNLEEIKQQAELRNKSVLAHGTTRVSKKGVDSIDRVFRPYLDHFTQIYFEGKTILDFEDWFRVIRL